MGELIRVGTGVGVAVGGNQITVGVRVGVPVGVAVSVGRGGGVLAGKQALNRNDPASKTLTSAKRRAKGQMDARRRLSRGVRGVREFMSSIRLIFTFN